MKEGAIAVTQGKETFLQPVGIDPPAAERGDAPLQGSDHPLGLLHRPADQAGPLIGVTPGAALFVDQLQRRLHHPVIAVTGNAGRPAAAEGTAVGTGAVILLHPDVAAAAEGGDSRLLRHAEKPPCRAHGTRAVRRIAAMAAVAADAVLRMDAPLPELNRFAVLPRQLSMTGDADDLRRPGRFHGRGRNDHQCGKKQCTCSNDKRFPFCNIHIPHE